MGGFSFVLCLSVCNCLLSMVSVFIIHPEPNLSATDGKSGSVRNNPSGTPPVGIREAPSSTALLFRTRRTPYGQVVGKRSRNGKGSPSKAGT